MIGSMADEEVNFADEVSDFLQKTCPRHPTWQYELTKYFNQSSYETRHPVTGMKCKKFLVNTGSAAELFIAPMLPCVDDVDVMYHYSNELAIPRGNPPPEVLPQDYDTHVRVFELVDSHQPGYVYLTLRYTLTKNNVDGKYVVEHVEQANCSTFLSHALYMHVSRSDFKEHVEVHGPAHKSRYDLSYFVGRILRIDAVPCIHCLKWPSQAADWPTRYRINGWPNDVTIDAVVKTACDVVAVVHPLCRNDLWMVKHQWRLSFSRAEVILLNSWTLKQQVLYHMLRTFVKTERLTKSSNSYGSDTFSNYHIKMLMLWACEITPQNWWTDEPNLISICIKLMRYMNEWLRKWHGQHYFVNDVHFCDYVDTADIDTASTVVESITICSLTQWFVHNYMCRCAELCPQNISLLCSNVTTRQILHDAVTAIPKWKDYIAYRAVMKEVILQDVSLSHFGRTEKSINFWLQVSLKHMTKCIGHQNIRHNIASFYSMLIDILNKMFDKVGECPGKKGMLDLVSLQATMVCCPDYERHMILQCSSSPGSSASSFRKAITLMKCGTKKQQYTQLVVLSSTI